MATKITNVSANINLLEKEADLDSKQLKNTKKNYRGVNARIRGGV